MRKRSAALTAGALFTTALLFAGCSSGTGEMPTGAPGQNSDSATASTAATAFNDADEMFVTMMIPHHEQAVAMSDILLAQDGVDPEVVQLAEQIKAAQAPEIELMKSWLENWGIPADGSGMSDGMGHMNHGDGMMSDSDMEAFEAASGDDVAKLFLEGMIGHHEGAIEMAQWHLEDGVNPAVARLSQQIIDGQTAEIIIMKKLLADM